MKFQDVKRMGKAGFLFVFSCLLLCASTSTKENFTDECHCDGCHGVARWSAKTDPELPPNPDDAHPQPLFQLKPSQMFKWVKPLQDLNESSQRVPDENQWYQLTGEVVDVKVEADGDIHIRLKDVDGNESDGVVGCEIPVPGQPSEPEADELWCELRIEVFGWSTEKFPFSFESGKKITLVKKPVVVITGKSFFDIDHAPKNGSNIRPGTTNYSVWEIHPVMAINTL